MISRLKWLICLCTAIVVCLGVVTGPTPVNALNLFQASVIISNTSGVAQTNWAVQLTINTQALINAGKMRADCGDMRFQLVNLTDIPYWLDRGCNTNKTLVWIRIPALPTGNTTVIIQYGDLALTSQSNGVAVMDLFEDMNVAPTCVLGGSAIYDSINKRVQLTNTTTNITGSCTYTWSTVPTGMYTHMDFQTGGGTGAESNWVYGWNTTGSGAEEDISGGGYHFTFDESQGRSCYTRSTTTNGAGINCSAQATIGNNARHIAEVFQSAATGRIFYDGASLFNTADPAPIPKTGTKYGFAARNSGTTNNHYVYDFAQTRFLTTISAGAPGVETPLVYILTFAIRNAGDTAVASVCDLGFASTTAATTCSYRLKITTNIIEGYVVYVKSDGPLINVTATIADAGVGTGGGGGTLITNATAGTARYGVLSTIGTLTGGDPISKPAVYDAGTLNSVRITNTTSNIFVTASGQNNPAITGATANTILVTHNLNIASSTVGGLYGHTLTYTVVPNF